MAIRIHLWLLLVCRCHRYLHRLAAADINELSEAHHHHHPRAKSDAKTPERSLVIFVVNLQRNGSLLMKSAMTLVNQIIHDSSRSFDSYDLREMRQVGSQAKYSSKQ